MVVVTENASAQVTEEWVMRYNGPGSHDDGAVAIVTDSSKNLYVTGGSVGNGTDCDYATVAYDSFGNELWVVRYNGPGNMDDTPRDITIDSIGNVYVTGESYDRETLDDFATIAYDSSGNELWVKRYNGPANGVDSPFAIACDLEGNIYVTGLSHGTTYGGDYATIKYDSHGNELWIRRYDETYNKSDVPSAMTIDHNGNVYVTGWSYGSGIGCDYGTVAYDSEGNELWVARYDGPGKRYDYAHAMIHNQNGNVYVTGSSFGGSYGTGTGHDYATVAYDSLGNELWVARYNGTGNHWDEAEAIAVDPSGNIYVTGVSTGYDNTQDYITIKYDSDGNELWIARYTGLGYSYDRARAIAIDSSGNIYVTGNSHGDYCTVAYDSSGNELWVKRYNGPGDQSDLAYDIDTDPYGNVYVTGVSKGLSTEFDFATIKYSLKPALQAKIDLKPRTLNLKSKGNWITTHIELPNGYDGDNINIRTVMLNDIIPAEWGDIQGDILMVKFDRSEVEDMLVPGTYNLKVTGELLDGTGFEGYSDEVRVIAPSK